ncbi:MAG: tetratricopeptide repeat protein [Bacteroidia bacterium]|jgi:tetratricopeptide (TPR) repeat protein|nr:tetratricopeptide repeat protein [Bacteroidia bacterium]
MAQAPKTKQTSLKAPTFPALSQTFKYFTFLNQKIAMIVVGIVGFVFYIASINGEYALDDGIIIHQNDHVIKGVRGIKDIMTKDAYESFYRRMCATDQLAGGRYRPLSVVSFAIEQQFMGPYRTGLYMKVEDSNKNGVLDKDLVNYISPCGRPETNYEYNDFKDLNGDGQAQPNECYACWDTNQNFKNDSEEDLNIDGIFNEVDCQVYLAWVRHFNNIWTYALGCMFLYLVFARYFFRTNQDLAFLAALLFTMHPIHSEAIANVKSRDEIFSLIFVSLTFLYSFKFLETKRNWDLVWASLMFLLALLSKEYAIMLLILVPLAVYTFTENDVYENIINTTLFKKIIAVLVTGIIVVFIHKGAVNSIFGKDDKMITRGISALIWFGLAYLAFKRIDDPKRSANLKKFAFTQEVKTILFIAVLFIASAAFMLFIKYSFDIKVPQPPKPSKAYWFFPFAYVIILLMFSSKSFKENKFSALMGWAGFIMLFYLGMRLVAVKLKPGVPDTEILNNPYLLANEQERFATKTYVLLKYLILQVFPHPLSSDYSFNTIQYRLLSSWDFIVSFILHLAMLFGGIYLALKRHIIGFSIITYILFALLIGNVLMDVGATMGERLIFHSNIGFCIAAAYLILKGFEKLNTISFSVKKTALWSLVVAITFLFGCKAWERSLDWKNDVTLFLKDVKTMPHSVLVLGNAGARWVDLADTKEVTGIQVVGQDSTRFNDYNGTLVITDEEWKKSGLKTKREVALYKGISFLTHAIELHPRYVNGYLNLGLAHFKLKKDFEALYYWKNAEKLYPNNPYLRNYYQVYANDLKQRGGTAFNRGRMDSAAIAYNLWTILTPQDYEAWYNLGGAYFNQQKYALAKKSWERCLQINPNYAEVKKVLPMITPQMLGIQPQTTVAPQRQNIQR